MASVARAIGQALPVSSPTAAWHCAGWEHRPGAMYLCYDGCRPGQHLRVFLLLDYCHHGELEDFKVTKTVTLRTSLFEHLTEGQSEPEGWIISQRENAADGRQQESCWDHSLLTRPATVYSYFVSFKITRSQRLVSICILHSSILPHFANFAQHLK